MITIGQTTIDWATDLHQQLTAEGLDALRAKVHSLTQGQPVAAEVHQTGSTTLYFLEIPRHHTAHQLDDDLAVVEITAHRVLVRTPFTGTEPATDDDWH